ncbi:MULTISPECIES: Inorganic pyrophosphatase [Terrabacteria group]|uniref:Inorganic pyrophosphatase n=1 Tax=Bacillati TaxID=1783272 RepID=UPI001939D597|nr:MULTISPECIES: Inorganic pyrophosphatase [Terrabacteria group]MBW9212244.1 hypothetical protein [Trueperella sp. zg.1013]QRG86213.1 Inorganic pyrophosphatase [Bulleidia sp. zg-1006]
MELQNSAYFWQKVDTLFLSSGYTILRKKGERHPQFPNLIYPADYGYVNETKSTNGNGASLYAGSENRNKITSLVIAVDILSREMDVKILVGCSPEEEEAILRYLNQTDYQKTILVRKGEELPSWAQTDD